MKIREARNEMIELSPENWEVNLVQLSRSLLAAHMHEY